MSYLTPSNQKRVKTTILSGLSIPDQEQTRPAFLRIGLPGTSPLACA